MNKNEYRTPRLRAARCVFRLNTVMASRRGKRSPCWRAKSGSPRAGDADRHPSGLYDPERLGERVSALGVQDDVVVLHDRLEVLRSVVDDDVGTELAHPFDVAGARRCRDGRHRMLNV